MAWKNNGSEKAEPIFGSERSLGALFSDLAGDAGLLLRQEIALAKAEVLGKIGQLGTGGGLLVGGGLLGFAGLLYCMAAAMFGLALVLPIWAAALVVGVVALVFAGVLALIGRSKMRARNLVPVRTIQSLKDDAAWVREQMP